MSRKTEEDHLRMRQTAHDSVENASATGEDTQSGYYSRTCHPARLQDHRKPEQSSTSRVPVRRVIKGDSRGPMGNRSPPSQVSVSPAQRPGAIETSQADSAGSIPVTRSSLTPGSPEALISPSSRGPSRPQAASMPPEETGSRIRSRHSSNPTSLDDELNLSTRSTGRRGLAGARVLCPCRAWTTSRVMKVAVPAGAILEGDGSGHTAWSAVSGSCPSQAGMIVSNSGCVALTVEGPGRK